MSGAPSAVYFRSLRQIPRHGSFNDRDDLSAGPSTSIWIFTTSATNAVLICEPTLITWPCGIEQSIKLERHLRGNPRSALHAEAQWQAVQQCGGVSVVTNVAAASRAPVDRQQLQLKKIENYLLERH
jgi:hypothetical protein